jgi:hypothetical protein
MLTDHGRFDAMNFPRHGMDVGVCRCWCASPQPGAFTRFMEILDGSEQHLPQETIDDLILLAKISGTMA